MKDLENLQYPIGRFSPTASSIEIRRLQIQNLYELPGLLAAAVSGLNDSQLDTPYREGGWTLRQVVHHIADSHGNSFFRFKLALSEDWPTIKAYDQAAWAEMPDGRTMPIAPSLALIEGLHARWVTLLESLSEADFKKGFVHPERGRMDLAAALAIYDWHSRHHTAHIKNLRARRGW